MAIASTPSDPGRTHLFSFADTRGISAASEIPRDQNRVSCVGWFVETMRTDDEGLAPGEDKLIPEWSVDADDQIIVLGLAVLAAFLAIFGWTTLTGDDDPATALDESAEVIAGPVAGSSSSELDRSGSAPADAGLVRDGDAGGSAADDSTNDGDAIQEVSTTAASVVPLDLGPDLAASIAGFSGASSSVDGTAATLTGYVATAADKTTAGGDALAVPGINSVDNQLIVLQPAADTALEASGVAGASVAIEDTVATVSGEVSGDADRATAIDAIGAVAGISSVVDNLTVTNPPVSAADVITELNELFELEPIQFGSGSATILDSSLETLDLAAAILADNATAIEIQGYTDTSGPELTNLTLSQARADAVLAYLVDKGVEADNLQSTGYGETAQFDEGSSRAALAANRRVRFELI